MYRNLLTEMAKRSIGRREISDKTGIHYSTLSDKLNEKTSFTFDETILIKKKCFPDLSIEYLFSKQEEEVM